jgi:hypothetical protein
MQNLLNCTLRTLILASLPAGLLAINIPDRPAFASGFDSCIRTLQEKNIAGETASVACAEALEPEALSACTEKITEEASLPAEDALKACFRVRRPGDLATCVVDIKQKAAKNYAAKPEEQPQGTQNKENSKGTEKIFAQSPTPTTPAPEQKTTPTLEPAQTQETPQPTQETSTSTTPTDTLALDTCRRSLLPVRFSECVVAVNNNVRGMNPEESIKACIKSEDLPTELSSVSGNN